MSDIVLDQQLLGSLKQEAKRKRRQDPSQTYNQWLDTLSAPHGYTYKSLKRQVAKLEQQARDQAFADEEGLWAKRFEQPMVWGSIAGNGGIGINESLPLPVTPGHVVWPNCFAGSSLFTCAEGPRDQLDRALFVMDDEPEMHFRGEELRVADDETVLQALISVAGRHPCGRLVKFSTDDLDKAVGLPLPQWGMPVQYDAIARSLWRLAHCELTTSYFKFKGPILAYADARERPGHFAIRFNPNFANFFYPILGRLFS